MPVWMNAAVAVVMVAAALWIAMLIIALRGPHARPGKDGAS